MAVDLAQVVFDLRRQSVIYGEEIKRLRSNYMGVISSVGDLEEKVYGLEVRMEELENEVKALGPQPRLSP